MSTTDFQTYYNTLTALRNSRGMSIIQRRETAEKLWNLDADLEGLVLLFSYRSSQGYEKFFADATVNFMEHGGYTLSDFQRVADLKDHVGNDILDSSNDFYKFMKIKGRIEDTEAVAKIRDSEGKTI